MMSEIEVKQNLREEILVDRCPVGHVILDENRKVHWAELYDDFIHSKFEAKNLKEFANKINEYKWVEDD